MPDRLTALQADTLRRIGAGNVRMGNTGTASFRIFGASPTVVGRLVAMKLARWPKGAIGEQVCELTDEGRAANALPPCV